MPPHKNKLNRIKILIDKQTENMIPKVCPVCRKKAKEHTRNELDSCRSKYLAMKISEVA
ncbi:MAG: hypothetical protein ACRD94_05135 [Nitrosopumilaceae archaeon]